MKKLLFVVLIAAIACNGNSKDEYRLSNPFKYTAYRWNDTKDSFGLSLLHYLEISNDGNYKLIQRDNTGNARYYYGFVDNATLALLINFVSDSVVSVKDIRNNRNPIYRFDFVNKIENASITFQSDSVGEKIKNIQLKLDSVINVPNKKQSAYFNIDAYLKKIIKENTAE
jgi:hypothetical protein